MTNHDDYYEKRRLSLLNKSRQLFATVNPETGKNYSSVDIAKKFGYSSVAYYMLHMQQAKEIERQKASGCRAV